MIMHGDAMFARCVLSRCGGVLQGSGGGGRRREATREHVGGACRCVPQPWMHTGYRHGCSRACTHTYRSTRLAGIWTWCSLASSTATLVYTLRAAMSPCRTRHRPTTVRGYPLLAYAYVCACVCVCVCVRVCVRVCGAAITIAGTKARGARQEGAVATRYKGELPRRGRRRCRSRTRRARYRTRPRTPC